MQTGTVFVSIAVDDFLVTDSTPEAIDDFFNAMKTEYNIKRLAERRRYLRWHIHYHTDGSIALSQRLLIDKKLEEANMLYANGKRTPYPYGEYYQP